MILGHKHLGYNHFGYNRYFRLNAYPVPFDKHQRRQDFSDLRFLGNKNTKSKEWFNTVKIKTHCRNIANKYGRGW